RLTVRWVPGHLGVPRNELADEEARTAAGGETSERRSLPKALRKGLPINAAKARQTHIEDIRGRAAARWRDSRCGTQFKLMALDLLSNHFLKLV
ncbi:hypothetical protein C8Q77DRAFT_1016294, partial [Trametes polyzona]